MYKKTICLMTLVLLLSLGSTSLATTYYVSSSSGNDNHSGTSPSEAWQSLDKVNTVTFQPGDEILLEAGSVWENQQLYPKGSGTSIAPIIVDMYGTGNKPLINTNHVYHNIIDGDLSVSAGLFLHNQEYWEISNLEITNYLEGVEGANLHGAYITAEETGICHDHIYLKNLDIHHVNAMLGRGAGRDKGKNNGGICIDAIGATVAGTMFNDVLIEGCYIYECGGSAIKTWNDQHDWRCHDPTTYHTNIVMRNNVVDHIQGDGLVTAMTIGTLIEYNVASWTHMKPKDPYVAIWNYEADDTIMQYNEAYNTQTDTDGQGFDIDDYTVRTIVQYNYSHDNVGGFMLIIAIPAERAQCGSCDDNIVRYNISQDDGAEIIKFAGEPHHTDFYNNVFYYSATGGASPLEDVLRLSLSYNTHVYNNIFETWGGGNFLQPDKGVNRGFAFHKNIVYGDSAYSKWIAEYPDNQWGVDPKFVAPGTGGIGRDTCGGYMLDSTSPAIDYGIWSDDPILMALDDHPGPIGADHGTQDYFGNTLPYPSGVPDAGVHESGEAEPDNDPPTPDPMTWATVPYATGPFSIAMTATTASDPSGVEYYFSCISGGGHDSDWQDGPSYEDTGLQPETTYTYTVKARDKSPNQNQTAESTAESATTESGPVTSSHVGAIDLVGMYKSTGAPSGRGYYAEATITVHDQDCATLSDVTVDITWSGCVSGTDSGTTDGNGQVVFNSPVNPDGGTFTCCVDNLTKSGYPYQSGDNHETCDSIVNP